MPPIRRFALATLAGLACAWVALPAAQGADNKAQPAKAKAPAAEWATRCVGASRGKDLDCSIEQRAVVTETGQLLTALTIRIPPETRKPVMMLQVPVGLFLPAGISVAVDDTSFDKLQLQTCDLTGCFAGSEVPAKLLDALKGGKTLKISFQNIAKKDIAVPIPLTGFKDAYARIE